MELTCSRSSRAYEDSSATSVHFIEGPAVEVVWLRQPVDEVPYVPTVCQFLPA
jgi:hypothetical protein